LGCSDWPGCTFKSDRHQRMCPSVSAVKRRISNSPPPTFHGPSRIRTARFRAREPDLNGYTWVGGGAPPKPPCTIVVRC
jgi:hypothetical protein